MPKSCCNCRHFEADKEDGNEGMGEWYVTCLARTSVSNLKQFPFKKTHCADFEPRQNQQVATGENQRIQG